MECRAARGAVRCGLAAQSVQTADQVLARCAAWRSAKRSLLRGEMESGRLLVMRSG